MSVANDGVKMSGNAKQTLYMCLIDYTKAFDRIKHDMLFGNPVERRSTRQRSKHNQTYLPPAESHSAI